MDNFKNLINDMFISTERALGIHITLLIIERTLWKVREKYEEASLISYSDEGIVLDKLNELNDSSKIKLITQDFISNFVDILSCLVGQQLANELTIKLEESRRS